MAACGRCKKRTPFVFTIVRGPTSIDIDPLTGVASMHMPRARAGEPGFCDLCLPLVTHNLSWDNDRKEWSETPPDIQRINDAGRLIETLSEGP